MATYCVTMCSTSTSCDTTEPCTCWNYGTSSCETITVYYDVSNIPEEADEPEEKGAAPPREINEHRLWRRFPRYRAQHGRMPQRPTPILRHCFKMTNGVQRNRKGRNSLTVVGER